ncbi:GNAT family N-acetyltransferase [Candidatus Solirubrobacter pratensis]|uniref:GNAT family N-acetyltransferase n=1 Tax=Candidatus Solirubrobacter pratensis TaxID=1298857 RepID=UPI0003F8205A|nr:GNAT family N-acetyltransferase [Candidatus Solirubrobacter pratensis]
MIAEVIDEPAGLAAHAAAWDELAVAARRPVAAPAWLLAWLRHAAEDVRPQVVVVRDGAETVAIAPFVSAREHGVRRLRLMGARTSMGVDVLCRAGREREAAPRIARALRGDAIAFDGIPAASPWPSLLGGRGLHAPRVTLRLPVPELRLSADWPASRSANFRQQMRRAWRRLQERGARLRTSCEQADVAAFARLHRLRWDPRGGSGVLTPGVEAMLVEAGARLGAERLRLFTLAAEDRDISSHLFLAAGGHVTYWLGGFDPAFAREHPAQVVILKAVEDAIARGDERLDLGPGAQPYKQRFATGEDALVSAVVPLTGPRLPFVLGDMAARRVKRALA